MSDHTERSASKPEAVVARRIEPSRHLYDGKAYTPAASTDLRKLFAELTAPKQQPLRRAK